MLTLIISTIAAVAIVWVLAYYAASAAIWSAMVAIGLIALTAGGAMASAVAGIVWLLFIGVAIVANIKSLRQSLLSGPIFKIYKQLLPQMSQTEQEALEAGTVWWDGDLFSGKPDWNKLLDYPAAKLTAEEQA